MQTIGIKSYKTIGIKPTIDLEVNHPDHNFYAEGLVTSNSHSTAYASVAAYTIFLKFKYPKEFFLSLLKMTRHEPDPIFEISKIQKELHHFNIKLLPPDIIKSDMDFTIEGSDIRFGLLSIKGISDKSIQKLNGFRNQYSNKFEIFQAAKEAGVGVGILSSLIQAGALQGFNQSRSFVVLESQLWNLLTDREKQIIIPMAEGFNYNLVKIIQHLNNTVNEKSKKVIKDSRMATLRKNYAPYEDIYKQNSKSETFANWYYERTLLGYTYDKTLKDVFLSRQPDLELISEVKDTPVDNQVMFAGIVKDAHKGTSKNAKKTKWMKVIVTDETEEINVLMFNERIEDCKELNSGKLPDENDIVIVKGTKKEDCVFANIIGIQQNYIFTKLSELKDRKKITEKDEKTIDF